jgi:hypothetical protein
MTSELSGWRPMRFWGIDGDRDRARLQSLRADPPGRAARPGARRSVFGAALDQWDALYAASEAVGPAASPILLFYALSQAGRALSAACIDGQPWRATGHGLHVDAPTDENAPLGEALVLPDDKQDSSFRLFCTCIGSPTITVPTRLGALWAANPHAERVAGLGDKDAPSVALNRIDGEGGAPPTRAIINGDLLPGLSNDPQDAETQIMEWLKRYPSARGPLLVLSSPHQHRGPEVIVTWLREDGESRVLSDIAPPLSGRGSGAYLRPALNDAEDTLAPLAVWFATLLALSSLARYHPERWMRALQRDRSRLAIPIEETLDVGRELLPHLILRQLTEPSA